MRQERLADLSNSKTWLKHVIKTSIRRPKLSWADPKWCLDGKYGNPDACKPLFWTYLAIGRHVNLNTQNPRLILQWARCRLIRA